MGGGRLCIADSQFYTSARLKPLKWWSEVFMYAQSDIIKCRQWDVTSQKHFQKNQSLHWPNQLFPLTTPLIRFTGRRNGHSANLDGSMV